MITVTSTTPLVKLGAEGQENMYPVFLPQVRRENPDWSFTEPQDIELLSNLGYQAVTPTTKPTGDVVEEDKPFILDGEWRQAWTVRSFNTDELSAIMAKAKAEAVEAIDVRLSDALEIGFPYSFEVEGGTEIGHVQLRDKDRSNITGCGMKADRLAAKGVDTAVMPFRTFENINYVVTPAQMKVLSDKAYDAYLVFLGLAWQLKDAVTNATVPSEVPAIPESLELPAGWDSEA